MYPHKKICGYKNLQIRVDVWTCGQPSSCFNATKLEALIFCDLFKTCSFSQLFAVLLSLRCGKPMHSPCTAVSQHPPPVSLRTYEKSLVWKLLGPLWQKALRSVFTS